jgi:hypothetical protein
LPSPAAGASFPRVNNVSPNGAFPPYCLLASNSVKSLRERSFPFRSFMLPYAYRCRGPAALQFQRDGHPIANGKNRSEQL